MRRMGLGPEHTPADFLEYRESEESRAAAAGGVRNQFSAGGSMIQRVTLDEHADVKEVNIFPIWYGAAYAAGGRKGVPRLAEPGSEIFERVLNRAVDRCKPFGTEVEIRKDRGVVRVS